VFCVNEILSIICVVRDIISSALTFKVDFVNVVSWHDVVKNTKYKQLDYKE